MHAKFPPPGHPAFAHFVPEEIEALARDPAALAALPYATSVLEQTKFEMGERVAPRPVVRLCKLSSGIVVLLRITAESADNSLARVLWAFGLLDSETVAL